jgi:hypothetical protein
MKLFLYPALILLLLFGCSHTLFSDERVAIPAPHSSNTEKTIVYRTTIMNERPLRPLRNTLRTLRLTNVTARSTRSAQSSQEESVNTVHAAHPETWQSLFDGKTLAGWTVPVYGGDGEVEVQEGNIVLGRGEMMTGIRYEKEFPKINYEIRYEAQRTSGYDFFAACTFPVKESYCTFINGGWGGGLVGLSSVNGYDASENSTSDHVDFRGDTWYRFRIRVTDDRIQVWLTPQDKEGNWEAEKSIVELETEDKELSTRFEVGKYKPLGFCTWCTGGQLRNIEYRKIEK